MSGLRLLQTECSPHWGGQALRTLVESCELARRGHRVWIAAPKSALLSRARRGGLPTLELPTRGSFNPRATLKVWNLVRRERIDLIHCHGSADHWACFPLRALGVPLVRWRHISSPVPRHLSRSFIYRHGSERVIATSADIARALIGRNGVNPRKVEVLLEGIDPARFDPGTPGEPLRRELGLDNGAFVFGTVAMLRPEKGHAHFIEAAASVAAADPRARFLIVGEETVRGAVRPHIEARLDELGLTGRVIFTGYREDVPAVLAALDALVVMSTAVEGVTRVIPEAFFMRKPVVATGVCGLPELVRHEVTGLLVPPGDAAAAAAAMRRLMEEPELSSRVAQAGHELARRRLSLAAIVDRIEAIQQDVLRQASRRPRFRL